MNLTSKILNKVFQTNDISHIQKEQGSNIFIIKDDGKIWIMNRYELGDVLKEWLESNCFYEVMIVENEVYLMEDIWGEGGAVNHKRFDKRKHWILNIIDACQYAMDSNE